MKHTDEPVIPPARVRDDELAGQASAAGARALLASITSESGSEVPAASPSRRWSWSARLVAGALTAGVLVAGVVAGPGLLRDGSATSYANSAVDIVLDGEQYVARIKDPFADHARYTEAFRAVGLNITLRPVPVSRSSVGEIMGMIITGDGGPDAGATPDPSGPRFGGVPLTMGTTSKGCEPGKDAGCVMVMRIPVGFTGKVDVRLGRQARQGEEYANFDLAMAPGEMFAGVRLRDGRPVDEILAEARKRDLTTVFSLIRIDARTGGMSSFEPLPADRVGRDWTVWNAWQVKAGVIRLLVTPERLPENPFYNGSAPPPAS
ncbi:MULTISPECIES: hypothetical protein [unclassified Streptosporangium]|uniref:hypothetical protein n=1 Tax=unclassified Streptosporangium TaxID=2632669 RepID=UPI002E2DC390|nr:MULTISPECIES: hypothetical protein [unclassified Streptosporangium]